MHLHRFLTVAITLALAAPRAEARILVVPDSLPTIQACIDATSNGDTVLVGAGRYFENVDFRGHNIVVASWYIIDSNLVWPAKTAIDGSQPVNPDTASCVRIVSGEDSTAQLVGFTITGGTGTQWMDEHGAGLFREGGGILVQASSPVIRNNIITRNRATDTQGCVSAGGGAIRVGDGNPCIISNVIDNNLGRYGAGIVLNYSGAVIRNNIIAFNSGGEDYGGGGIWAYSDGPAPKLIENCAIAYNHSALMGGGMRFWSTGGPVRNCIVWGNIAQTGAQIHPTTGGPPVTYSDVQGGRAGTGNIDADPNWTMGDLMLHVPSPCIDSGDSGAAYYDPDSAGVARWPALGSRRNDMGAYGGPLAHELGAALSGAVAEPPKVSSSTSALRCSPQPATGQVRISFSLPRAGRVRLSLHDVLGREAAVLATGLEEAGQHDVAFDASGLPVGVYLLRLTGTGGAQVVRLRLVH